jgi:cellulose biosynthesis protein BcsQ
MTKDKDVDVKQETINTIRQLMESGKMDDLNPTLALIITLDKIIDNFESKDIISKSMAKAYALVGNTNQVQKDLINEIIAKQNDSKGKVKKMYYNLAKETLKSVKNNLLNENSRFSILNRR